jgi:hypothetical protein
VFYTLVSSKFMEIFVSLDVALVAVGAVKCAVVRLRELVARHFARLLSNRPIDTICQP